MLYCIQHHAWGSNARRRIRVGTSSRTGRAMTTVTLRLGSVLFVGAMLLGLVTPAAAHAEPPALDWETGAGKSYVIPAAEIAGFLFGLNQFNRHLSRETDYDSDPGP